MQAAHSKLLSSSRHSLGHMAPTSLRLWSLKHSLRFKALLLRELYSPCSTSTTTGRLSLKQELNLLSTILLSTCLLLRACRRRKRLNACIARSGSSRASSSRTRRCASTTKRMLKKLEGILAFQRETLSSQQLITQRSLLKVISLPKTPRKSALEHSNSR